MEQTDQLPTQYCLYARKSTEQDEKQALSIDSQIKEMLQIAEREGIHVKDIRRESHSAKASGQRPVYNKLIEDLRKGEFNGILTWAPDRLSRNAGDLGSLVDLMDQKILHEIRTYSQRFTNSPNEKFLLMILCSQAKLENDNKSINVKRGLRTRVEMGLWPGVAPTGYLNEKRTDRKCEVIVDPERGHIVKQIFEKVANDGWSGRKVYTWLKDDLHFTTKTGNLLSLSNIYLLLKNTFYYGMHEYPKNSGNWYTGKHIPLISKELFDKVQEKVTLVEYHKIEGKEFAFTKLFTCGLCGSGVTADEKFKKLKDGGKRRHVYYTCTKNKDKYCKGGYINEDEVIKQLQGVIEQISLNEIGLREKIEDEVSRYNKFRYGVLGIAEEMQQKEVNVRNYAKYILQEGTIEEKRELLGNLKSRLVVRNKKVELID